jgi:two-component system, chemotaxis family, protein-glutamate methylesterase/glutaminase
MTRIVVLGTSSGGIEALRTIVAALPEDFPVALCVVMHTAPEGPGVLPDILDRASRLLALHPRDGERLKPGRIYVAPPDYHLVLEPGRLRVTKGPRENRFRPAIDPLFRSAAQVFGPGAIGVMLTGSLDDGTSGLDVIKRLGGIAVVQDPADALYPSMPRSAIEHVAVDHIVPLAAIAPLLTDLTSPLREPGAHVPVPEEVDIEVKIAKSENPVDTGLERIGEPSQFACPECHGVLLRFKDGKRVRFRCHTGHAYSADSLVAAVNEGVEDALWNAVRALEEAGLLLASLVAQYPEPHDRVDVRRLSARAEEARKHSNAVRALLNERQPLAREDEIGESRAVSDHKSV